MSVTLKDEFNKMYGERSHIEHRWYNYSGWTLPYLYMRDQTENTVEMQHDYQAVGAQSTNHLANKIVTVLFQPGKPFFKLELNEDQKDELRGLGVTDTQVDELLSMAEVMGMKDMAKSRIRTALLSAVKGLIVLGNALLYYPDEDDDNFAQNYSLKDYVIQRDMSGRMFKLIMRDNHVVNTLPETVRELVMRDPANKPDLNDVVSIYTGVQLGADGRYHVWQEIEAMFRIPNKTGVYTKDDLPWIPLTWNLARGFNYGTGLVEEYAGDFHTLSSLSEALVNLSSIVSDIKILVNPMGQTDIGDLNDSPSGTYVYGNEDDISYLQLEKFQDMNFLHQQMETYSRRIGAGFLFNSAVTRDAERVTAEEIRMQANELEGSLGGIYSHLAEEAQLPIAKKVTKNLGEAFKGVTPTILTGMESLSRTSELEQIMLFFGDLAMLSDLPERAQEHMDYNNVISVLGAARRVEYKKFLLPADTVDANRKQRLADEQAVKPQPAPQQPQTI